MINKDLLEKVGKLGYPLFDIDNNVLANKTISEVVKSNDIRLWEGFPIIFANANENNSFNFNGMKDLLEDKNEYRKFIILLLISVSLYKHKNIKFSWIDNISNSLKVNEKNQIQNFLKHYKNQIDFNVGQKKLNPQRITNIFGNYFIQNESEVKNITDNYNELSLEYSLSQLFTTKQKEILLKRVKGKKLTKTEREYFYRVVKKKAIAITNPDLQQLAKRVIG